MSIIFACLGLPPALKALIKSSHAWSISFVKLNALNNFGRGVRCSPLEFLDVEQLTCSFCPLLPHPLKDPCYLVWAGMSIEWVFRICEFGYHMQHVLFLYVHNSIYHIYFGKSMGMPWQTCHHWIDKYLVKKTMFSKDKGIMNHEI